MARTSDIILNRDSNSEQSYLFTNFIRNVPIISFLVALRKFTSISSSPN